METINIIKYWTALFQEERGEGKWLKIASRCVPIKQKIGFEFRVLVAYVGLRIVSTYRLYVVEEKTAFSIFKQRKTKRRKSQGIKHKNYHRFYQSSFLGRL